jgi:hypothetical protein
MKSKKERFKMEKKKYLSIFLFGLIFLFSLTMAQQQSVIYEGFPKLRMVLISFPLEFDENNPDSVLGPIFGIAGAGEWWRFSRWNIADHTYYRYGEAEYVWDHEAQAYNAEKAEQGNPHAIAPGYGFWLQQSSENTVTDFSLTGTPVNQSEPVYVPIDPPQTVQGHDYPGITMVGNPFLNSIDWADAQFRVNGSQELTLAQAVTMGLVSQYAYRWVLSDDGDQYVPYNMTDGGNFTVWDGYWVEQLNPEETKYVVYDVACTLESSSGGDDCGVCPDEDIGQMKYLKLQYNGTTAKWIKVKDNQCHVLFWGEVQPGAEFEFYGVQWKQSMGPKINLWTCVGGYCCWCDFDCEIHTSCSVPIGPGQVWGSFTIIEAISKNDVVMCPIEGTNKPVIEFSDAALNGADADLGAGGAIETDRLVVTLVDTDNDEVYFKTFTVNNDSSDWIVLTQVGQAVMDGQGFTVTLISNTNGEDIFDVASSGSQSAALASIKFRFGDQQTISSPSDGSTYTATRTLFNGVEVTSLELKTPPVGVGKRLAKADGKFSHPVKAESAAEWIVPIGVASSDGKLIDNFNGLGVKAAASDMFDLFDTRDFTPNLDTYVDLYFPHHEINNRLNYWPQKPMKAAYDIRSNADVIAWDFRVDYYNAPNCQLTLSWDASQYPAADKELTLVNFQTDERINMLVNSSYNVTTAEDNYGTLYFAVVAADQEVTSGVNPEDLTKPDGYSLLRNYPNPFNAVTKIYYTLPEPAEVTLNIYTIKGALVKTLVSDRQPAGYYGLNWNGTDNAGNNVSSGIYIYQLRANDQIMSRKMVLMK